MLSDDHTINKNSYLHGHDFSWFINRENNIRKVERLSHLNFIC